MKSFLRLFSIVILFLLTFSNVAFSKEWTVSKVFQPAQYSMNGKSWKNIEVGTVMPSSSWIQTGKRGRLILNRGKELIQFKPNTMASITKANADGSKTLVKQQFGSLLVDVETKNHKHFKVETPYLAAVVKGTRFIVDVGATSARLSVLRGTVEVSDEQRGERVDVHSLQTVKVSPNANHSIRVDGIGPKAKVVKIAVKQPKMKSIVNKKSSKNFSNIFGPKKSILEKIQSQIKAQREKFNGQVKAMKTGNYGQTKSLNTNAKSSNNANSASSNAGGNGNANSNAGGNSSSNSSSGNSASSNAGGNGSSNSSSGNSASSNAGGNSTSSNSGGNGNGNGNN